MIMNRGCTLIDVLILTLFSGLIASVAAPGVAEYDAESKKSEAKINLKMIANGAMAFYESEHMADDSGMLVYSKSYPHCGVTVNGKEIEITGCKSGQNPIGKPASTTTVGTVFNPGDYSDAFASAPWKNMYFEIRTPFRYYYDYVNDGKPDASQFAAKASASLYSECDSIYWIKGTSPGRLGVIVDTSDDKTTCNAATLAN